MPENPVEHDIVNAVNEARLRHLAEVCRQIMGSDDESGEASGSD